MSATAAQEATPPEQDEPVFSLELTQDQRDIRDWVHGFAADVVRPAAAEWDEREETPWPIIQEAAKIGLYGFEALAQFYADPTGLTLPIVNEELFWGDAGIGMAIMGTSLAVAGDLLPGHARADGRVDPAVLRHARGPAGRRVLRLRARRRLRRLLAAHPRALRRGQGRVGAQRPEGVGDQRRHRQRARGRSPPSTASSARAARPRSSSRPARQGLEQGTKVKKHGLRASHTADVFLDDCRVPGSCLLGGKEKLDERLARAREGTQRRVAGGDADVRGDPARPSARRRSASPAPPTSTRSTTPRSARSSGARSSRTRRSRSRSPT